MVKRLKMWQEVAALCERLRAALAQTSVEVRCPLAHHPLARLSRGGNGRAWQTDQPGPLWHRVTENINQSR
jgi:hypothetical protein